MSQKGEIAECSLKLICVQAWKLRADTTPPAVRKTVPGPRGCPAFQLNANSQQICVKTNLGLARVGRCVLITAMAKTVTGRVGWEIAKKLVKAIPYVGALVSVAFIGHAIKKKGLLPGAVHVGLDVTPVVGTAKNVVEIFTGDWIPDKQPQTPQMSSDVKSLEQMARPEKGGNA